MNPLFSSAQISSQLSKAHQVRIIETLSHADDNRESVDEELGSNSCNLENICEGDGSNAIKSMWSFKASEFDQACLNDAYSSCKYNLEHWQRLEDKSYQKDFF